MIFLQNSESRTKYSFYFRRGTTQDRFPVHLHQLLVHHQEIAGQAIDVVIDLFNTGNQNHVAAALEIIKDAMPIRESATALVEYTRLWFTIDSAYMINNAVDCLGEVIMRRKGESSDGLLLSDEENSALSSFFTRIHEMMPHALGFGDGQYTGSYLHSLINRHPELSTLAIDLVHDLFSSRNTDHIVDAIQIVHDRMPFREAVQTLSSFLQNQRDRGHGLVAENIDHIVDAFNTALSRNRTTDGILSFSEADNQIINRFFGRLGNILPGVRRYEHGEDLTGAVYRLLVKNPELIPNSLELISFYLLLSPDRVGLHDAFRIVGDCFNVEQAANALTHFIRENPSSEAVFQMGDAIDALGNVLERRKVGGKLTPGEAERINRFFRSLANCITRVRRQEEALQRLKISFHTLITENPELSELDPGGLVEKIGRLAAETLIEQVSVQAPAMPVTEVAHIIQTRRAAEVSSSINRYNFLSDIFSKLQWDDSISFMREIDAYFKDGEGNKRLLLLREIFSKVSSSDLGAVLTQAHIRLSELPQILNDQTIIHLVEFMLDDPERYKFQLGSILSQIPLANIPKNLQTRLLSATSDSEFKVKMYNGGWWLCSSAEPRLARSVTNQAVVLVNSNFLVKFDGKFSAVCLETVSNAQGTFVAGNWYSPTDTELKLALRDAFDSGIARINLAKGEWTLMRPLAEYDHELPDEMLTRLKDFADQLPDSLPPTIDGVSRKQYRLQKREEH